jgi:FlaA1/EpsC-like NDP-sugar epimerase
MNSKFSLSFFRNRFVLIGDIVLIIVSVLGSFALRYDVGQMAFYFPAILIMSGVALLIKIPTYYFFGLYRRLWMYASTNELKLIAVAVSTASVLTAGVMLALSAAGLILPGMPRTALSLTGFSRWCSSVVRVLPCEFSANKWERKPKRDAGLSSSARGTQVRWWRANSRKQINST